MQLATWQKDAVHALSPQAAADWLAPTLPAQLAPEARAEFAAAVRANVVSPADAAYWSQVVFGDPPPPDAPAMAVLREAGAPFFAAAAAASVAHARDWPALVAAVKAATGRKGPALFKPLRCARRPASTTDPNSPRCCSPEGQATLRLSRYAH